MPEVPIGIRAGYDHGWNNDINQELRTRNGNREPGTGGATHERSPSKPFCAFCDLCGSPQCDPSPICIRCSTSRAPSS